MNKYLLLLSTGLLGALIGHVHGRAKPGFYLRVRNGYNPVGQDYDQGYGQPNGQSGIVSGRVRPGEVVSIGNGRGNTNVIAINSGRETDYYYGYSGNTGNNDGYGQNPTYPGKKESGIVVNKQPGQDDVVLWNRNGGKQSSIAVNRDGAVLYSGNDYQEPYPYYNRQSTNYNTRKQGYGPGTQYQSSSSIVSSQQQTYLNSHRYH